MGRRGRVLTRWRAPQVGETPLYVAAQQGHHGVVQALATAGADKDAPQEVRGRRGGYVGSSNGVCVPFWGVAERLLTVSALTGVGGPRDVPSRGIALIDPRARSWTGSDL